MICPSCGNCTRVVDCVYEAKVVYRRRKCLDCEYTFYTTESETPKSSRDFHISKCEKIRESKNRAKQ